MKKICLLAIAGLFVVSIVHATVIREKFATDPALDGWQVFGDTNLFQWDSSNHVLDVTWDSTQPTNSYYYLPLDRTYTMADSFYVQFDLQLSDAVAVNSGAPLAIGLLHFSDATNSGFSRGDVTATNVCEFDYYPAYVYAEQPYPASVDATLIDASGNYNFAYDNLTMNPGVTYRVVLIHQAGAGTISGEIFTNGQPVSWLPFTYGSDGDFQVDTLSINNYSDDGYDSILAHGTVGNLAFASPLPVGLISAPAAGQVQFLSDTNWLYTAEQSTNLVCWTPAAPALSGNGTNLLLQATNLPVDHAFYRVRADLP